MAANVTVPLQGRVNVVYLYVCIYTKYTYIYTYLCMYVCIHTQSHTIYMYIYIHTYIRNTNIRMLHGEDGMGGLVRT